MGHSVTVTKPGCRTDESVLHVTGHGARGCRIDSNGTVSPQVTGFPGFKPVFGGFLG